MTVGRRPLTPRATATIASSRSARWVLSLQRRAVLDEWWSAAARRARRPPQRRARGSRSAVARREPPRTSPPTPPVQRPGPRPARSLQQRTVIDEWRPPAAPTAPLAHGRTHERPSPLTSPSATVGHRVAVQRPPGSLAEVRAALAEWRLLVPAVARRAVLSGRTPSPRLSALGRRRDPPRHSGPVRRSRASITQRWTSGGQQRHARARWPPGVSTAAPRRVRRCRGRPARPGSRASARSSPGALASASRSAR